ncbi:MAG TPA: hypothetical protein VI306_18450 [Pyrinomonadaceae bacterium]
MSAIAPVKELVEQIADAVLYEGYILYPYRPSAVKNQQRWNFGAVCPEEYATAQKGTEISSMQTECLVEGDQKTRLSVKVRFLHLTMRQVAERISDCRLPAADCGHVEVGPNHFRVAPQLVFEGKKLQTWQEAVEREVLVAGVETGESRVMEFTFPASETVESLTDQSSGEVVGVIVRTQSAVAGSIEISSEPIGSNKAWKLSVVIKNRSPFSNAEKRSRDEALMCSLVSTHTILTVKDGAFVSLLDPTDEYKEATTKCVNSGTYPVLAGVEGARDSMLSSPIILYDYPQIAPQSAGNLFDGTEIDEILTLRIMTLTDEEKHEIRSADEMARQLLERTESTSAEQLMKLHGVIKRG